MPASAIEQSQPLRRWVAPETTWATRWTRASPGRILIARGSGNPDVGQGRGGQPGGAQAVAVYAHRADGWHRAIGRIAGSDASRHECGVVFQAPVRTGPAGSPPRQVKAGRPAYPVGPRTAAGQFGAARLAGLPASGRRGRPDAHCHVRQSSSSAAGVDQQGPTASQAVRRRRSAWRWAGWRLRRHSRRSRAPRE
jgi:hypothetical protein